MPDIRMDYGAIFEAILVLSNGVGGFSCRSFMNLDLPRSQSIDTSRLSAICAKLWISRALSPKTSRSIARRPPIPTECASFAVVVFLIRHASGKRSRKTAKSVAIP